MYSCNGPQCFFTLNSTKVIVWHVIRHHLPIELFPFIAQFATTEQRIKRLLRHFDPGVFKKHQIMNLNTLTPEEFVCTPEPPYNVTFTNDKSGGVQILAQNQPMLLNPVRIFPVS